MRGAPFSNNKAVEPTVTVETDLKTNKAAPSIWRLYAFKCTEITSKSLFIKVLTLQIEKVLDE